MTNLRVVQSLFLVGKGNWQLETGHWSLSIEWVCLSNSVQGRNIMVHVGIHQRATSCSLWSIRMITILYCQVLIHLSYRKYFYFVCNITVYQFKVLYFRLVIARQVFTWVFTSAWYKLATLPGLFSNSGVPEGHSCRTSSGTKGIV